MSTLGNLNHCKRNKCLFESKLNLPLKMKNGYRFYNSNVARLILFYCWTKCASYWLYWRKGYSLNDPINKNIRRCVKYIISFFFRSKPKDSKWKKWQEFKVDRKCKYYLDAGNVWRQERHVARVIPVSKEQQEINLFTINFSFNTCFL